MTNFKTALLEDALNAILTEQRKENSTDTTTIGGVTATRHKHEAIERILQFFRGTHVQDIFDSIR